MNGMLEGKTAIVYGGGGSIGGGIARAFAREGAHVALVGRTRSRLDAVADDVRANGGSADVAVFDALDEAAVDAHVAALVADRGGVDVSINLVSRGDVQGTPLVAMAVDDLLQAPAAGLRTNFLTARAAARVMSEQGRGAILHLNSGSAAAAMPGMGSTGPADAAIESFYRYLAAETGPAGVRVCGIWTAGVFETLSDEKIATVSGPDGPTAQSVLELISSMSVLRRTPGLADVAETATFLASDRAGGITGSMVNVTAGLVLR